MAVIGALIYRIGADVSELKENVRSIDGTLSKLGSAASMAGKALAGMFVADKILGAVNAFSEMTGKIADLSARTGMGTDALQRFKFAAEQSGTSLEAVTGASEKLANKLAGGDKSAVAAMKDLGLNVNQLKTLKPEDLFVKVGEAVSGIENPMQKTQAALTLFGKSGAELLPMLTGEFGELMGAADRLGLVLDESTIQAGAKFGDQMDVLTAQGQALIANALEPIMPVLIEMGSALSQLAVAVMPLVRTAISGVIEGFLWLRQKLYEFLGSVADAATKIPLLGKHLGFAADAATFFKGAADIAGDSLEEFRTRTTHTDTATTKAIKPLHDMTAGLDDVGKKASHAAKKVAEYLGVIQQLPGSVSFGAASLGATGTFINGSFSPAGNLGRSGNRQNPFAGVFGSGLTGGMPTVPGLIEGAPSWLGDLVDADPNLSAQAAAAGLYLGKQGGPSGLSKVFGGLGTSFLGNLSGVVQAAFQGGGSLSKSVGGLAGSSLGGMAGGAISSAMKGLGGLGPALMGALGNALPGIGALVGPLIGNLFGKLFGPSKGKILGQQADARIGQTQAGLLQQYGSVDAIASMGSAGAELAAAWGSKNVAGEKQFNALVEAFQKQNDLLAQQKDYETQIADLEAQRAALVDSLTPKYQDMVSAAGTLGISMDGLGQKVDQLAANEGWGKTVDALDTLVRGGADVGGVLERSASKLSEMVQQSMKLGTAVPENMRPYLQNLADAGKLLDENGNKITDLSNLKWGDAIETEADKTKAQISAIDKLIEGLKSAVQTIVDTLANKLPAGAAAGVAGINDVINRTPISTIKIPVDVEDPGIPGMAAGGVVTRPTLTWIGERGPEAVVPLSQYGRFGAGAGGAQTIVVQNILDGDVMSETVMRRVGSGQFAYAGVR